jgi:hypothetical protein
MISSVKNGYTPELVYVLVKFLCCLHFGTIKNKTGVNISVYIYIKFQFIEMYAQECDRSVRVCAYITFEKLAKYPE